VQGHAAGRDNSQQKWFAVLRHALPVGGRCLLIGGVASQPECPQPRSLFLHRALFGLVFGHCLLALTQLLFFLEQSFGANTMPEPVAYRSLIIIKLKRWRRKLQQRVTGALAAARRPADPVQRLII
jgi:hypothetical protein